MKKIILYIFIMIGTLLLPTEKQDVANLEPIQAVWLRSENEKLILQTDTEDIGIGRTVAEALADMKLHSPGIVYLDTAEYLLVDENATTHIQELNGILRKSVHVSLWNGEGELVEAARYMRSHKSGMELGDWAQGTELEKIPKIS